MQQHVDIGTYIPAGQERLCLKLKHLCGVLFTNVLFFFGRYAVEVIDNSEEGNVGRFQDGMSITAVPVMFYKVYLVKHYLQFTDWLVWQDFDLIVKNPHHWFEQYLTSSSSSSSSSIANLERRDDGGDDDVGDVASEDLGCDGARYTWIRGWVVIFDCGFRVLQYCFDQFFVVYPTV